MFKSPVFLSTVSFLAEAKTVSFHILASLDDLIFVDCSSNALVIASNIVLIYEKKQTRLRNSENRLIESSNILFIFLSCGQF